MPQDVIPLAPLPSPGATEGQGSADLAADLMKGFATAPAPAAPSPEPAKKEETPSPPAGVPDKKETPAAPAKKEEKATPAAPAPAPAPKAKEVDPDDPKLTAPDLRRELKRLRDDGSMSKREYDKQMQELRDRVANYEKRRYWTDEDLKQDEAVKKRLAEMEGELYSRDYATSPEYKSKYQDRLDQIWGEASEEVKGLTVKYQDGLDAEDKPLMKERAATQADLLQVIDAPATQRMAIAKRLFGDDREPVLQWARDIAVLRRDAAKAIEEKRTGYSSEMTKRQQELRETNQKITGFVQQATTELEAKFADIFAPPTDKPEIAEALKKGFAFVDESSAKMMEFTVNERAARVAAVRAMAGAFPRLLAERHADRKLIEDLRAELKKFQGTDPSEMGGGGGGGRTPSDSDAGSDALAQEIDKLTNK